ncbi:flagellar export chaperone FliS [Clostridium sp. BNL1100]|uniref:flagellar export chaperone FliS n=1 Tax=Clostridium sp. BNL1100 TaxID=755731 RepID=UPI00024A79DB|nr:flagellar export chaperone FliS [Clostridium sp. BNL1100]AEY64392.1 flagellar biosynthetic protein FliS [Clostridium sp. BNL1100]
MMVNNGYNQYKENSVYTATPEELTLMLYNGLVKFIMLAQSAIDEKNIERANNSIIRAQDIVREFQVTLDMKYEVSKHLDSIYDYMYRRLIQANIKKDKDILEEVLAMAKDLRDTWTQAMKLSKRNVSSTDQIAR